MEKLFEWSATFVLMIGVALTAWNIYPANIYFSLLGNAMWMVLGFMWKKWSLITIQALITVIYILGIIFH
jgi:hypothetical protein